MTRLILLGAVLLAWPVLAQAQAASRVTVAGSISTGARTVGNDSNSSKLTEFRDLEDDAYVPGLSLNLFDTARGWYFDFSAANVSLDDQTILARGGLAGRWKLDVDWLNTPHNLSNKAVTPLIRRGPGLLEVPATVPITFKKLATVAADAPNVLASDELIAGHQTAFLAPTPLRTDGSVGHIALEYAGAEALKLAVAYDRRRREGLKSTFGPIGDRPPRTLNIQLTEPVDSRTQDITVSGERVGEQYQMQVSYLFSDFANRVDTLVWENIFATAPPDATADLWDRAVSTFGRRPLAPDNRYHNVSFSAARDLPADSRLSGTFAYGHLTQNEPLLALSFNTNVLANPSLPRAEADAGINTVQALVDYVINPASRLNLRSWARYYGLDNNTPKANWQYVTSDTANLNGTVSFKNKRINLPYASDRTNAGVDAAYHVTPWRSSVGLGYELESIDRDHREQNTDEHRVTASFRARPARWANLRARYLFGDRGGTYDPFVTRESYWYGPEEATDRDNPRFTFSNHPDMRRFDTSDRRRHQTDVTLTVTPRDVFSLAGSVRYRNDDFDSEVTPVRPLAATGVGEVDAVTPGTQLGLLEEERLRFAVDTFYMPTDRVSVNAFVSWDKGTSFQRSLEFQEDAKVNPSTQEGLELGPWTRASSQWTADFDDRTWTAGAGTTLGLVPDRVSLSATYTFSLGDVDIDYAGFGVVNFDGTPFPPNHPFAFPSTPPRINQDLHVVDLRLEFPVVQGVVFLVGYSYERYRLDDWQQGSSFPWVEPVSSEFLLRDTSRSHQWGNRLFNLGSFLAPGYDAHIGWAAFTYRF